MRRCRGWRSTRSRRGCAGDQSTAPSLLTPKPHTPDHKRVSVSVELWPVDHQIAEVPVRRHGAGNVTFRISTSIAPNPSSLPAPPNKQPCYPNRTSGNGERVNRLRIVSYTMMDYGDPNNPDPQRWALGENVLADTEGDIIAVCDVMGGQPVSTFTHLVHQVGWRVLGHGGMSCLVPGNGGELLTAFQEGWRGRGVGLMWRNDRVTPVPGSLRRYDKDPMYRGMVVADFIVDDVQLTVASTHLAPQLPDVQWKDHVYVATELVKPDRHAVVCAHWNMELEWRRDHGGRPWRDIVICSAVAQREVVEELEDWGLFDPVAHIDADGYATVGHCSDDAVKRVDGPLVSRSVADATEAVTSVNNPTTQKAGSHLPVILDITVGMLKPNVLLDKD